MDKAERFSAGCFNHRTPQYHATRCWVLDVPGSFPIPFNHVTAAALFFPASILPVIAQATDFCTEAWVLRNMIVDRSGYCFGSVTGKTLFDNADCNGSSVNLLPVQTDTVKFIREGEAHVGCRIDTSRPPNAEMRQVFERFARFTDLPAPDYVGGYACWGYRGPAVELRAGASAASPVVASAEPGQSVVTKYHSFYPGWQFYDIRSGPGGETIASGWVADIDISERNCDRVAG